METFYTILRADGTQERGCVDWPLTPDYKQILDLVSLHLGTDQMEHVFIFGDKNLYQDMFVDEIGHWKNLTRNEEATRLYRRNTLQHKPGTDPERMPYIVGAAVVFDRIVWT